VTTPDDNAVTVEARLAALAERVHAEAEALAYPSTEWVKPMMDDQGSPVYDVIIIGAGQSGLAVAQGLRREGVRNLILVDRSPKGFEGPWSTFARMACLRTPKFQVGMDHGLPSLTTRAWYEAKYGRESWLAVDRLGREDWMDYLRWYRDILALPVHNEVDIEEIAPERRWLRLIARDRNGRQVLRGRRVVLATGFDGGGAWAIPPAIAARLPAGRGFHSNTVIDFTRFRAKRIGILGHGASAFDAAGAALAQGAATVDLCFRRSVLPTINPHRRIEFVGFLKHFPELDDAIRWRVNRHFDLYDQPPARHAFDAARRFPNFAMHAGSPWQGLWMEDDDIHVVTPQRQFVFDYVVCATGSVVDLAQRQELRSFAGDILLWRECYAPPPEERHEVLALHPYLGPHYEFRPRRGGASWLNRLYAFNFAAVVSMGPHSTSISGHKYSVPRLIRGITSSLFLEQQDELMSGIENYRETEIDWPLPEMAADLEAKAESAS
jgi:FAD-dependent urate hydroxylase